LLLSFIKKTKILNWIYFIFFLLLCFTHIYIFIDDNDKLSVFLFVSLFFSIFISALIFLFLRKQGYEISIWGLICNIEMLITMFYQWFFFKKHIRIYGISYHLQLFLYLHLFYIHGFY
jgi:hypothetical protein